MSPIHNSDRTGASDENFSVSQFNKQIFVVVTPVTTQFSSARVGLYFLPFGSTSSETVRWSHLILYQSER